MVEDRVLYRLFEIDDKWGGCGLGLDVFGKKSLCIWSYRLFV